MRVWRPLIRPPSAASSRCDRGIAYRRVNVVASQARVSFERIGLGGAFAELMMRQFDRDPCLADHLLAERHARIHFDAVGDCHSAPTEKWRARQDSNLRHPT